jgi:hypothetical protein
MATPLKTAPVANAGAIQNGSTSSDANGDALTYTWALTGRPAGSTAALTNPASATPSFTADVAGTYVASLVVNDGQVNSAAATVTINAIATNATPVANAGTVQNVITASTVTLNGSASSDANGDSLTYAWTLTGRPTGSTAALANPTSATPGFTADVAGAYVASLVVNDGRVNSTAATVTINATVTNAAPVANAGAAQNVITASVVTLNGSASSDANGDALTYAWTLTSRPAGSSAALANPTSATPGFTADVAGTYVASLVVNDGRVNSTAATVTINATVANAAPVANAGPVQNVATGSVVRLNGSASSDANGDALTYVWTLTGRPAGSSAALANATSATPGFTADVAGTYVASLVVNDGKINSSGATVSVQALSPAIQLYSVSDGFFGGGETLTSLPYTSSSSQSKSSVCVGSGCATDVTVATFRLAAVGGNFTITGLTAVNQTTGSNVVPSFTGLTQNQAIGAGTSSTFELRSPFTRGATVNLRYSFTLQETGQQFDYAVQLRTN